MEKSVCFIGHRKIKDSPKLREHLQKIISGLIENGTVNFIFGDHSDFNDLCYETITKLKEKYPKIRRINFRRNYEDVDDYTLQFLIKGFEETICPKGLGKAGRASYAERNQAMIRESDICIFYYDESYLPTRRKKAANDITDYQPKSGTALAFHYAQAKNKFIINCFENC